MREHWTLDSDFIFLNHGSFGAVPSEVQAYRSSLCKEMEAQPVRFLARELPAVLDENRAALAAFVGCAQSDLALVPNATYGINSVLGSYPLSPGDRLLVTDHEYNACRNALDAVAQDKGAAVDVVELPLAPSSAEEVVDLVLDAVRAETKLALVDHITSGSALLLPAKEIIEGLHGKGVHVLIDGAHGPGHVPLNMEALGADFYTGNCHKWMGTPRGCAFLFVRPEHQDWLKPAVVSHGRNAPLVDGRTRFQEEFEWGGTTDPTPWMCIKVAIDVMGSMVAGGWPEIMERNRALAREVRDFLATAFSGQDGVSDLLLPSMVSFRLPDGKSEDLHLKLVDAGFEVPVMSWPPNISPVSTVPGGESGRVLRVSCQLYNDFSDYERLMEVLPSLVDAPL
ncbi:MAG TPA: aminotransferase [Planctomycetes bacterium]|nr:aminotransferase [Planctomycetota bacterium]